MRPLTSAVRRLVGLRPLRAEPAAAAATAATTRGATAPRGAAATGSLLAAFESERRNSCCALCGFQRQTRHYRSSSSDSSSSSNYSSSSTQQPVGRRSRARSYDPPLTAEYAEAERRERMPRSPQTTGGWSVSWAPYKPPNPAAAANTSAAAAAAAERSSMAAPSVGYAVPYRFRVEDNCISEEKRAQRLHPLNRPSSSFLTYTDFVGTRLPVLDTTENVRYWKDEGLDRLLPRVFPLKLPAHRRIDPLLRELIFCLAQMDPRRFGVADLAMRYGLREKTVHKIIREFSLQEFLRKHELATPATRRISRAEAVLNMKEIIFKQKLGYEQTGTEEIDRQEENEFEGWKSTFDWVTRQHIEVETMSAFPLPAKRDPVPKRVDVDLTVKNTRDLKVISWIDPNEKVVF
ncbi:hypothetical protein Efla_004957 [Eimeria flavescens]